MRVIVVGTDRQRGRLRGVVDSAVPEIVGEFGSIAEARRAGIEADALLMPIREDAGDEDASPETLTRRERQVLELVAEGLPNKAIAARLDISDQTVKFHIASIIGKLGGANRTDVVRRAVRRGLISL